MATIFSGQQPFARTASSVATGLIREAILEGKLGPGERLVESQLAQELGISRTPIREALLLLQAEGLVDALPNRGATVRAYDVRELEDMYELRALLEGQAARRAATRMTAGLLAELRDSCTRFDEIVGVPGGARRIADVVHENTIFHEAILEASGSARLARMVRQVVVMPLVYKSYVWYSPEQARLSLQAHVRLVEALTASDPDEADAVMREHVYQARDVLVRHVSSAGGA